jgi:hypothetical protein
MADGDGSFPDWIEDASWDTVFLGTVFLPGVCTLKNFKYGQDIDVQKRRKKEKARLRDNGLAPCGFDITVELTAKDWPAWVRIVPAIQPRREGAVRTPLAITHPLCNLHGVKDVYVHFIEYDEPSARKGMKITIRVAEWFEEEKESKGASKKVPESLLPAYSRPDYFAKPNDLADTLQNNAGIVDEKKTMNNLFNN